MEIKDTILLPKTDFSMKADLPKKEPSILEKWQNDGIYKKRGPRKLASKTTTTQMLNNMIIYYDIF